MPSFWNSWEIFIWIYKIEQILRFCPTSDTKHRQIITLRGSIYAWENGTHPHWFKARKYSLEARHKKTSHESRKLADLSPQKERHLRRGKSWWFSLWILITRTWANNSTNFTKRWVHRRHSRRPIWLIPRHQSKHNGLCRRHETSSEQI